MKYNVHITSAISIKDNIEQQCWTLKKLGKGIVGPIRFYRIDTDGFIKGSGHSR